LTTISASARSIKFFLCHPKQKPSSSLRQPILDPVVFFPFTTPTAGRCAPPWCARSTHKWCRQARFLQGACLVRGSKRQNPRRRSATRRIASRRDDHWKRTCP
jgi:hypothetical protein